MPARDEPAERVDAMLEVVHLVFTTGPTGPVGTDLVRRDLVERSVDLARMLAPLLPEDSDVAGLLALILLSDAHRSSRVDGEGHLVLVADQNGITTGTARRSPRGSLCFVEHCGGAHIVEALGLDRRDVDLSAGVLTVRDSKFAKTRELPLRRRARPLGHLNTDRFESDPVAAGRQLGQHSLHRHLAQQVNAREQLIPGPTNPGGRSRTPLAKDVGEPCAGEPHARFDGRELETERSTAADTAALGNRGT